MVIYSKNYKIKKSSIPNSYLFKILLESSDNMEEYDSTQGYDNFIKNDTNGNNLTHILHSNLTSNSTAANANVKAAGIWTLNDIIILSCITAAMIVLSVVFYVTRWGIRKIWPNTCEFKPKKTEGFKDLDEQNPKENWYDKDQGIDFYL